MSRNEFQLYGEQYENLATHFDQFCRRLMEADPIASMSFQRIDPTTLMVKYMGQEFLIQMDVDNEDGRLTGVVSGSHRHSSQWKFPEAKLTEFGRLAFSPQQTIAINDPHDSQRALLQMLSSYFSKLFGRTSF